ncbi:LOW QUALITY PROTEIN: uridylate-specific endoribonuclease D-like [Anomaloglossus baeobatrachus]|uniref:LOW QUALITY PROTEIN: uridylate-specific endoribonuclease D-like n=1 Tax=Anomaloglossus baeobatrachus TaxID=238106 RepID=UPI003F5035A3
MKSTFVLLWLLPCVISGAKLPRSKKSPTSRLAVTNDEIQNLSKQLYFDDVNRAGYKDIILNLQYNASSSETGTGTDYSSQKLFTYVNEDKLFTRPTFARLISLLDNYVKNTGTLETISNEEIQEQVAFIDEVFQTTIMKKLSSFFIAKGYYTTVEDFENDLREMWFGLYARSKGSLDSSGFEHVFHGEIHKGKISGFHSWVNLYLQEKAGEVNYLSYSSDGPWTSYPDVFAFQFNWSTYLKTLGSFFMGSSPEFDIAMYTLCYVTRPDSACTVQLGNASLKIQTYSWANSSYGNGKRYLASSYPNI